MYEESDFGKRVLAELTFGINSVLSSSVSRQIRGGGSSLSLGFESSPAKVPARTWPAILSRVAKVIDVSQ